MLFAFQNGTNRLLPSQPSTSRAHLQDTPSTSAAANQRSSGGRSWQCIQCPHSFPFAQDLAVHSFWQHKNEKPFKCSFCPATFKRTTHCYRHERELHRSHSGGGFRCGQCARLFANRADMNAHAQKDHGLRAKGNQAPLRFQCDKCNKCFASSTKLNRHMWIHRGDDPKNLTKSREKLKLFRCSRCDARFEQRGEVATHLKECTGINFQREEVNHDLLVEVINNQNQNNNNQNNQRQEYVDSNLEGNFEMNMVIGEDEDEDEEEEEGYYFEQPSELNEEEEEEFEYYNGFEMVETFQQNQVAAEEVAAAFQDEEMIEQNRIIIPNNIRIKQDEDSEEEVVFVGEYPRLNSFIQY